MVTLTIEKRSDPNPLNESGSALVFPTMAGRAVGYVAMLVKQDDATKLFLAPSGWQAEEYRWLSGPVRDDGQDLIVPLEETLARLVGRCARLRVVLLDAGIEGLTAATEPAVSEPDEPQSAPPPPPEPAVVAPPARAVVPSQPLRLIAPAVALVALVALAAVGTANWRYAPPRAGVALPAAAIAAPAAAAAVQVSAAAPPSDAGGKVFEKCDICHEIGVGAQNSVGPALNGVVGRKAGSDPRYSYSAANKHSGITWDEATLKEYLKNPRAKLPGTKMLFPGLRDDQEISSVIAYLKQFGPDGKPPSPTSIPSPAAVTLPVAATAVPEATAAVLAAPPPEAGASGSSGQSLASQQPAEMPAAGSTAPVLPSAPRELAALEAPAAPSVSTSPSTSSARGPERYWVQFGAFSRRELAEHVKKVLCKSGVAAAVARMRVANGQLLFVVRSVQFPDRDGALALGHRGHLAAQTDFLLHRVEPNHAGVVPPSRLATNDR
jgi:cytochrome c